MTDEERKARIAAGVKWGLAILAAAIVAPVVFLAIGGIVGVAVAGAMSLAIVNFAPVVALRFATWRVSSLKAIARQNPIETRQVLAAEAWARLAKLEQDVTDFAAAAADYEDKVEDMQRKYPQDAQRYAERLIVYQRGVQLRQAEYAKTKAGIQAFEAETERLQHEWDMAVATDKMNKRMSKSAQSATQQILARESAEAVRSRMNRAFAGLEMAVLNSDDAPPGMRAIENSPAQVIELTTTATKENVPR